MSNMTKTIAILGVVAGLGVAALPLSTYAAPVQWQQEGGATGDPAAAAEAYGTDASGKHWVKTDTTIKLNVPDALSIEAGATELTLSDGDGSGKYTNDDGVTVHVISRNNAGYTLSMLGSGAGDPKTSLVNQTTNTFTIPTSEIADITAFDKASGSSAWGYRIMESVGASVATDANKYLAVAAASGEDAVIANENVASDYTYKIGFGAVVDAGQAAGDYVGKVTFIATNNQ